MLKFQCSVSNSISKTEDCLLRVSLALDYVPCGLLGSEGHTRWRAGLEPM